MKLFEIDSGKFINMDNVFKFELFTKKENDKLIWKFYSVNDQSISSKEFADVFDAITWLNMTLARSEGANEVITL
ncbi:MAG: hypothetical protein K9N09_01375 [Candidatus Cloacimonetes bacterium]|nr:hypothetical protein [Candidatus Cloacimonadota bacterium]MCF7814944.1 hypothetical protein [Candidatus Cloacimonadota bacterium]MCF7867324.1 hypothetical protein [Candidatus Cloacimonadota bacterium]MCF7882758.1 hypothetical protein [Candidatus Cloacimonadota bacterium]